MDDFTHILTLTLGDTEPVSGHVYLLRSAEGTVLYAGQTVQPLSVRIRGHYNERPSLIRSSAKLEAEELPAHELLAAEAQLIHHYHPPMNRMCPMEDCNYYVGVSARRRSIVKSVLPDAALADTVHSAISKAREAGEDRLFSADLLELISAEHPGHNLRPGQIRQKVTAAIGSESKVIYDNRTQKMARGWYLAQHT